MAAPEILLASDLGPRSDRALDRALGLARERDGRLVIAHVLERGTPDDATKKRLAAELPDDARAAELALLTGSAPAALTEFAAKRGSAMIVTGVARYNALGDYVLGTAVDHIVRTAVQPVLVVRSRVRGPYRRLLVASDFSDCSAKALIVAARLFPDAALTVVHAYSVPFRSFLGSDEAKDNAFAEAHRAMDDFLSRPDLAAIRSRIEPLLDEGETTSVVLRQAVSIGADLIVLGTHGRSGFAHATIGSQAEAVLATAPVDVLMIRE